MRIFYIFLLAITLGACSSAPGSSTTPTGTHAPSPTFAPTASFDPAAAITVTVFQDLNRDGQRDPTEPGVADQIGLAPDTNCTIGDPALILPAETDPTTGEFAFTDLAPGEYCVMYRGDRPLTTEPAYNLSLTVGQQAAVAFGLAP